MGRSRRAVAIGALLTAIGLTAPLVAPTPLAQPSSAARPAGDSPDLSASPTSATSPDTDSPGTDSPETPFAGAAVLDDPVAAARPIDPAALNPAARSVADLIQSAGLTAPEDFCLAGRGDDAVVTCGADDLGSSRIIALVGDSRAGQWLPALDALGRRHRWRVRTYLKRDCAFTAPPVMAEGQPYLECQDWGEHVLARLTGTERPTVVMTTSGVQTAYGPNGAPPQATLVEGYAAYWRRLAGVGVLPVILADTPRPSPEQITTCLRAHPDTYLTECARAFAVGPGSIPLRQASRGVTQARWIDLGMRICPDLMCWPVIGDTLVYRDGDYLSTAYAASLAPALWRLFVRVAPATIPVPGMTTP